MLDSGGCRFPAPGFCATLENHSKVSELGLTERDLAMKRVAVLGCALILAVGLAAAEVKPKIVEMDAADGASEGHWVVFVSRLDREGARTGSAVVAEGNGKAPGSAFGLATVDSKQKAATVSKAQYKEIIEGEAGVQPTLIKVSVTAEQHKKVKDLIAKYAKKPG